MAKITTIGMYSFDPTLFDNVVFPAGINKQIAVDEILTRSGEFEIIYPDVSFFKTMIEHWANKHYRTFEKWAEGLAEDFNPLYNYDRYEEYEDEKKGETSDERAKGRSSLQNVSNSSDAITGTSGSRSGSNAETSGTDSTTENTVSAFDSSSYEPKDKQEQNAAQSNSSISSETSGVNSASTGTSNTSTVDNETGTETGTGKSTETIKHNAHLYGNIGVTTSSQMLKEFLEIERWNIYEHIADLFVDEFCILVY